MICLCVRSRVWSWRDKMVTTNYTLCCLCLHGRTIGRDQSWRRWKRWHHWLLIVPRICYLHSGMWTEVLATQFIFKAIIQWEHWCNCNPKHVVGIWCDLSQLWNLYTLKLCKAGQPILLFTCNYKELKLPGRVSLFLQGNCYLNLPRTTMFYSSLHPS